jgi:hypothetical protein
LVAQHPDAAAGHATDDRVPVSHAPPHFKFLTPTSVERASETGRSIDRSIESQASSLTLLISLLAVAC